jgi:hypothetical protein
MTPPIMLPSHCYERNSYKSEAALVSKAVEGTKRQLRAIRGPAAARPGVWPNVERVRPLRLRQYRRISTPATNAISIFISMPVRLLVNTHE